MMKKILFFVFPALLFSCNSNTKIEQRKCVVNYCVEIDNTPKSIHEEMNMGRRRWKLKTSCGNECISSEPYKIGDTLIFKVIRVK
jgi:hypothetical protein